MLARVEPDHDRDESGRSALAEVIDRTGVRINPNIPKPYDIRVRDEAFYNLVLKGGMPAFCNAYIDGMWDCQRLDQMFEKLAHHIVPSKLPLRMAWPEIKLRILSALRDMQSSKRAFMVGKRHYDIGNELFERMLDPTMAYSCAYFGSGATTLEEAQIAKYELICKKLKLTPGMLVGNIGCGWCGLDAYMIENYGVNVVGVTVSEEQKSLSENRYRHHCDTGKLRVRYQDYRTLPVTFENSFDRIVSVGMFEHVGPKHYREYFRAANECLRDEGLVLLHSIGGSGQPNAWIHEAVFPNGVLPSELQILKAIEGFFKIRDWHGFGQDYARTLAFWDERSQAAKDELSDAHPEKYTPEFWRFWHLYLKMCEGGFKAGRTQLWQIVLSKNCQHIDYRSVR